MSAPAGGLLLIVLVLIGICPRPATCGCLAAGFAGLLLTAALSVMEPEGCLGRLPDGARVRMVGELEGLPRRNRAAFRVHTVGGASCPGAVRLTIRGKLGRMEGSRVMAVGQWRSARPGPVATGPAGTLVADSVRGVPDPPAGASARTWASALSVGSWTRSRRRRLQARILELFGEARAPLVEALVLARREGLDPELREAFAVTGTAHLLAISGFHVGVFAVLLFSLARAVRLGRGAAAVVATAGVWGYVIMIGAPAAATRAAAILSTIALGRLRGRPTVPVGALATVFMILSFVDPRALASISFQLSFAGAGGLVLWRAPLHRMLVRWAVPPFLRSGLAAGIAATLATSPLVAWHFDRISVVGIPMTLIIGPLVALAIPGVLLALAASGASLALGRFLAGGVDAILAVVGLITTTVARHPVFAPWVSPWVPRGWLLVFGCAALIAGWASSRRAGPGLRSWVRHTAAVLVGLSAVVGSSVLPGWGFREEARIVVLDVGQGDAIAVRSPRGRWLLVDAGGRSERWDSGERVVVPFLRRMGVSRLEALLLTHPDLDHIGGAEAVLNSLTVAAVADPGLPVASETYVALLGRVREEGSRWWTAMTGTGFELDGMTVRVLYPDMDPDLTGPGSDSNRASLVLVVEYGEFRALLTGDAPKDVEEEILAAGLVGTVNLLKVGHHGSDTSTGQALLDGLLPEVAAISVGERNRYGHPHPSVLRRLEAAGVEVFRTDLHGRIDVRIRPDGSYTVTPGRAEALR